MSSPRAEVDVNDSTVTRASKEYPKPWLMTKKPTTNTDTAKSPSVPKDQNNRNIDNKNNRVPDNKDNAETMDSGDTIREGKDSNSKRSLTRRVTLPARPAFAAPRRDRTRLRIQRAKTQALLDARERDAGGADDIRTDAADSRTPRKYSNVDAANVYYVNAAAAVEPLLSRRHSKLPAKNDSVAGTEAADNSYDDPESRLKEDKPKEYILNKREADMYVHIRSVYDKDTEKYRKTRERRFYDRVQQVQREKWKEDNAEYRRRQQRARESKERQARQLKRVRGRFDEEQVRRFNSQYVTGKVLEHEWQTRHIYGLPDNLTDAPQYAAKLRPQVKRPQPVFDPEQKLQKNRRRYKRLFRVKRGPRAKTPKMEGIDTIVVGGSDTEGRLKSLYYFK